MERNRSERIPGRKSVVDGRRGQESRQRDKGDRISGRETEGTEH
jgi:hypothetical protein